MSFALRLESAPLALQRRLFVALAAFALAACLLAIAFGEPAQRGTIALASLACFVIAFGRRRLARSTGPAAGSLSIDEQGGAQWTDGGDPGHAPRAVRIERWNVLGACAWLRLRPDGEREELDVMFVRPRIRHGAVGANGADDWRRLRAWLLWYGRGAVRSDSPSASASARQ